jgi:hypothetical protein
MWYQLKCISKYSWLYDALFHCHLFFKWQKYDIRFYKLFPLCVLLQIGDYVHYSSMRESKCYLPERNTFIPLGVVMDVKFKQNVQALECCWELYICWYFYVPFPLLCFDVIFLQFLSLTWEIDNELRVTFAFFQSSLSSLESNSMCELIKMKWHIVWVKGVSLLGDLLHMYLQCSKKTSWWTAPKCVVLWCRISSCLHFAVTFQSEKVLDGFGLATVWFPHTVMVWSH